MQLSQVLPQLFVGSCPTNTDDINHLKADYGITAILNLQTDHDFDYCDLDWGRIRVALQRVGNRSAADSGQSFRRRGFAKEAISVRAGIR